MSAMMWRLFSGMRKETTFIPAGQLFTNSNGLAVHEAPVEFSSVVGIQIVFNTQKFILLGTNKRVQDQAIMNSIYDIAN